MKEILEQITFKPDLKADTEWLKVVRPIDPEKLAQFLAKQQEEIEGLKKKVAALKDAVDEDYNEMVSRTGGRQVTENPDGSITYKGKNYQEVQYYTVPKGSTG